MPKDTREPQEILAHVTASRVALTSAIYGLSEAELTMAGAVGRWSVKDVMAHLGRWEEICLAEVQKHLRGEQSTEDYRDALPYNDRWEAELHMLSLQEAIGLFETVHYRLFGLLWCQQLPNIRDNPGQQRARRPGSVQPASVPSAFQQVISPGHVRQSTRAGTCSLGPALAPPPCVSAHLQTGLACFSGVSLHRLLPSSL